ncbi:outer membrane beta-barrel protein [Niveispirillum fermenti]|uniref:outer membrane beta-barrel protein n=1 Tax=Niveispirillum fermenti TaxID=1233113 RepID=UPI003A84D6DE
MRRITLPAVALLAAAGVAHAEDKPYQDGAYVASSVGAYLGNDYARSPLWALAKGQADKKFNATLAAGYRLDDFRFEIEGGFGRLADVKSTQPGFSTIPGFPTNGDVTMWTALAGAYVDVPVTRTYQPYLGLGGGVARLDSDSRLVLVNDGTHAAAFGEVGLNMVVWRGLTMAPGYRYLWVNAKGGGADNVSSHIVKLTARARF